MRGRTRRLYLLAAVLLSIGGLAGGRYGSGLGNLQEPADSATAGPRTAASGPVVDALTAAGLVRGGAVDAPSVRSLVDAHTRTPNYDRAAYGPSWADTEYNGCDQRNDVLARDLTAITYTMADPGSTVATGHLADVYTGRSIDLTRGKATRAAVQIDHLVPTGGRASTAPPPGRGTAASSSRPTSTIFRPSTDRRTRRSRTTGRRRGSHRPPATTACTSPVSRSCSTPPRSRPTTRTAPRSTTPPRPATDHGTALALAGPPMRNTLDGLHHFTIWTE